jgi:hypothetical protein
VTGDCLGDFVPTARGLVADPTADIEPLDLVAITIWQGDGVWARYLCSVGRWCGLRQDIPPMSEGRAALVGQLFPPAAVLIPESEVEAIHRVVGSEAS